MKVSAVGAAMQITVPANGEGGASLALILLEISLLRTYTATIDHPAPYERIRTTVEAFRSRWPK